MAVIERKIKRKDGKESLYLYVEIPLPGGKKLKRSIGKKGLVTKTQARQVEQELKRKIRMGQLDVVQADITTFNEFVSDFISYLKNIKENRSWEDAEFCVRSFAKFFGDKKLSDISSADVEDYKRIRTQEDIKPATINKALAFVRHLFNYAKKNNKYFGNNPVSIAGLIPVNNKKERILSIEEERKLLECCRDFFKPMVSIALNAGMRNSEIRKVKWEDVDFQTNNIRIEMTNSKNKRTEFVPMNKALRKMLLEQKLKTGSNEYVFQNMALKSISNVDYYLKLACDEAGISGLRFHDLRHTAATRMLEVGHSIQTVSKILRHSSIITTMRYYHPDNSLREAVESLANFGGTATNIATNEDLQKPN